MRDEQIRILCQHAVKYAPNGIAAEAVAEALGMRYATLMSQLSAQPGHKLGAEIVLPIMVATGCRAPIRHMAAELGGVFMELPPVSARNDAVTQGLVASVREFGEFAAQVAQSIDDGVIRQEELRRISADGMEAVTAILQVIRRAERFCALKHKEDA
ncbi:MAG TPA: transcriptional regulator [Candidatus Desulfovibrio intestinigallinarum]|nr:transcriptional regulator [Candidatus Desulfovibrio intestinigallinarum]